MRDVRVEQRNYTPGKQVVLRYEVDLAEPGQHARTLRFYGKTYGDSRSRYVYRALVAACERLAGNPGPLEVPRTLLHLDPLYTYWLEEWSGGPLSTLYGTPELVPSLPRVAAALAQLHRLELADLEEAPSPADITRRVLEVGGTIARFLPGERDRVIRLADRVAAAGAAPLLGEPPAAVAVHGAFRMTQLLGRGTRIAVTDFDKIARGDPHLDVAEFEASHVFQHFRRGLDLSALLREAASFRVAYEREAPWPLDARRLDWLVSVALLERLRRAVKSLKTRLFPRIDEIYALVECYLARMRQRWPGVAVLLSVLRPLAGWWVDLPEAGEV